MAGTIVSVLTQIAPALHRDMQVEFLPSIFVKVSKEEDIPIDTVADAYNQGFHTGVHTMQDFAGEFEGLMQKWKSVNAKFIFVTNVGIAPTPDHAACELEANRLHRCRS